MVSFSILFAPQCGLFGSRRRRRGPGWLRRLPVSLTLLSSPAPSASGPRATGTQPPPSRSAGVPRAPAAPVRSLSLRPASRCSPRAAAFPGRAGRGLGRTSAGQTGRSRRRRVGSGVRPSSASGSGSLRLGWLAGLASSSASRSRILLLVLRSLGLLLGGPA